MQRSLLKAGRALEKTGESVVIRVQFSAKVARAPCAIASRGAEKNRSGGRSGGGRPCRAWVRGVDGAVRTNSAMRAALSGAAGSRRRLLGARRETERITTQVCEGRNHRAVRFLSNPSRRSEYERSQSQRRESTFGARVLPRGWATWPHRRTRACKGRSHAARRRDSRRRSRVRPYRAREPTADAQCPLARIPPLGTVHTSCRDAPGAKMSKIE